MSATGALIGLLLGGALLLISAGVLASRRPQLADRILVRAQRATMSDRGPAGTLLEILRPVTMPVLRLLGRDPTRTSALSHRLSQAGRTPDVERYRLEQVAWGAAGAAAGIVLGIVVLARRPDAPALAAAALVVAGSGVALLLHDRQLAQAIRRRGRRMSEQLPTFAELLAFAVAAGEAPLSAMDRVSRSVAGELADEVGDLVHQVRAGAAFLAGLRGLADRCPSADVARFVDGIAVATERGTPMADVLRAQAADARAAGRRALLESAGKKEVLMLVPVVFFILPVIVVIALFPGIHGLNLTVS